MRRSSPGSRDMAPSASPASPAAPKRPLPSHAASVSGSETSPRSATVDAEATSSDANTPAKRFQVPRACNRCKTLRRGCSEFRPCKRCVDAGLASHCLPRPAPGGGGGQFAAAGSQGGDFAAAEALTRMVAVVESPVLDYCMRRFFERLYPTIPILSTEYLAHMRAVASSSSEGSAEACCLLVAMSAQVLLQAEEPEEMFHQGLTPTKNGDFGRTLTDAALTIHASLPRKPVTTLEQCLLTFFLYTCQSRLSHHSHAFFLLREATTLFLLLRTPEGDTQRSQLSERLFWVLLVSERSHAIRYRRPATLAVWPERMAVTTIPSDPTLSAFWSLASLFRPIDTAFIALLNQEEVPTAGPTLDSIASVEQAVNTAVNPSADLLDTQKANLRITQLWLRVIIWQLRLRLGHLREKSYQHSLTYQYPLDIAKDLMLSTRDLPIESIRVHGVGLTEKLFDVASAVIDVLAKVPLTASSPQGPAMGTPPEEDLQYLRKLIFQLPGGDVVYDDLLEKHMQQALPSRFRPSMITPSSETNQSPR